MKHSAGFYLGIICAFVLGFGLVAAVWYGLSSEAALGYVPSVLKATKTGPNTATLDLSTYPDSHVCHTDATDPEIDWVTYCPTTNFELPANSTVTIIIANFDSATPLHNDYFDQVQGTTGGTETVNGQSVSQVDASTVSHTFTIQSKPGTDSADQLFVSVPIVGVADDAATDPNTGYPITPNLISFSFKTGPAGTEYVFKCYDPCGNGLQGDQHGFAGPMATIGYMAGFVNVTSY
ncbi:MAG TPA: hypothetical protein VKT82_32990 [Ktedonobacterales bacterium]|nr:hypothetical protein [Ktedonobacterales bacterium]